MIRTFLAVLTGLLRELTDHGPYQRYLAAHGLKPSGSAWRQFTDDRHRRRYQKPKCC